LTVKRPARPYKNAAESGFTVENAKAAETPRAGPDHGLQRLDGLEMPGSVYENLGSPTQFSSF
jgi:hypothetical protein